MLPGKATYHIQLLPHGAPVSQRRGHFCDNGVFGGNNHLKLPVTLKEKSTAHMRHGEAFSLESTKGELGGSRLALLVLPTVTRIKC